MALAVKKFDDKMSFTKENEIHNELFKLRGAEARIVNFILCLKLLTFIIIFSHIHYYFQSYFVECFGTYESKTHGHLIVLDILPNPLRTIVCGNHHLPEILRLEIAFHIAQTIRILHSKRIFFEDISLSNFQASNGLKINLTDFSGANKVIDKVYN